jgi:hypothetical protein
MFDTLIPSGLVSDAIDNDPQQGPDGITPSSE